MPTYSSYPLQIVHVNNIFNYFKTSLKRLEINPRVRAFELRIEGMCVYGCVERERERERESACVCV